jgi:hypothetical protein
MLYLIVFLGAGIGGAPTPGKNTPAQLLSEAGRAFSETRIELAGESTLTRARSRCGAYP